jgi:DNA-binding CsgD family transcriptional regulator
VAIARELGYPSGQVRPTAGLVIGAVYDGDLDEAVQLARQGMQIPDIPGTDLRCHGYLLAGALAAAGDLAAAEQACAATLAQARDAGDMNILGDLLRIMAELDLQAGRTGDAAAHLREAAQLSLQTGAWLMTLNVLKDCGHLCAATGRFADAVTVWAAWGTFNQQGELAPSDADMRRHEDAQRHAREALGPDRARAAEQRGAAMSMATAAEYALMLTAPSLPPAQAAPGTAGLSARERELVTLVAQGRTDTQIAGQLHISIRTVRSHLDRIRDKTGCRRRADLTRVALSERLV